MKEIGLLPWVLVFITLFVEYCSANVEAMGSNPTDAPNFFGHLFAIAQIAITTVTIISSFKYVFLQFTS